MSIDWQILEETKKKWYRKGLWRGILISIIIITAIYLFMNLTNFSSNFSHIARININGIIFDNSEIVEIIDNLANNDNVKSVFVKINSPGGTVVGSESLYTAINSLSQKTSNFLNGGNRYLWWLYCSSGFKLYSCKTKYINWFNWCNC